MKRLRTSRRVLHMACAAAAAMGLLASPTRAAEKLVFATYFSEVYSASKTAIWMMDEIEKRSGGEIKFEKYWSSSLLKAPDLFPALRSGAADIVIGAPHGYNVREYPLANVVMPFTSTRADAMTHAWQDLYKNNASFRKEFESKGAKALFSMAWAENTVWSRKPINSVADLKGLKIRAVPTISDALQKLGATPVALTWPDGLEGLQRGVVDAMASAPFDSAVHGGAHEVAKYGTDLGGTGIFAMATFGMGLERYNKMSEKHRKIIDEVSAEAAVKSTKFTDDSLDAAVQKLCKAKEKIVVTFFPPAEVEKVQKIAAASMQDDWIKRAKNEAHVDGRAMLDEYIGYVRNYEKTSTYVPGFERYNKTCGKN
ncbi:MAG: C4-dicarboxylate TRAP transporter substrate-binding protein [Hyphomicrobiaceae bacterium]